jgi:LysM domain
MTQMEAVIRPRSDARRPPCRTGVPPVRRQSAAAGRRVRRRKKAVLRRRVALALICIVIVVLTLLGGGTAPASRPGAPRAVVVQGGQTLWALSARYAPDGIDVRAYIDAVIALNDLSGPPVVGQRLRLPR